MSLFSIGRPKMSYAMAKPVTVLSKPTISVVSDSPIPFSSGFKLKLFLTFTVSQHVYFVTFQG